VCVCVRACARARVCGVRWRRGGQSESIESIERKYRKYSGGARGFVTHF
jgi:hypothetical protein